MSETLYATFDGEVLRPDGPVSLKPNTRVRLTIEDAGTGDPPAASSFLETARNLRLQGPVDCSKADIGVGFMDSHIYILGAKVLGGPA